MPRDLDTLTDRQRDLLALLDRRLTLKQVAAELGISESAVNQLVRRTKEALNCNSLPELVDAFRACRDSACRNSGVVGSPPSPPSVSANDPEVFALADVTASIEAPWAREEPRLVPRWLDGENAVAFRLAAIGGGVLVSLMALILSITAMRSLSEEVGDTAPNLELEKQNAR